MKSKLLKKLGSIVLATAVVMTMGIAPAFAETPVAPDKTATVAGITEADAVVTAYKIVKEDNGEWKAVAEVPQTGANALPITLPTKASPSAGPTSDQIGAIAKAISAGTITLAKTYTLSKVGTSSPYNYTYDGSTTPMEPGLYVVLVKNTEDFYNPMIIGIDYDEDTSAESKLDLPKYEENGELWAIGNTAYAKKGKPEIKKEIVGGGVAGKNGTTDIKTGNSAEVGDELSFEIKTTVPSYSAEYVRAMWTIVDELDPGLTLSGEPELYLGTEKVTKGTDTYSYTETKSGSGSDAKVVGFTIDPASIWLLGTAKGGDLTVKYKAKVNDNATFNFDPNNNEVTLKYQNKPNFKKEGETGYDPNTDPPEETGDITHTYTFGIDGELTGEKTSGGEYPPGDIITEDIIKTGKTTDTEKADNETTAGGTSSMTEKTFKEALAGAEFTMYTKYEDGECSEPALKADGSTPITGTTDDKGYLKITGLKAGTYYMKETKAPKGYSIVTNPVVVVITADYNDDGTLKSYKITMDGKETSNYKATYNSDGEITKLEATPSGDSGLETLFFEDPILPGLPTTGGMGTYLFLLIGMAVMVIGAIKLGRRFRGRNEA